MLEKNEKAVIRMIWKSAKTSWNRIVDKVNGRENGANKTKNVVKIKKNGMMERKRRFWLLN